MNSPAMLKIDPLRFFAWVINVVLALLLAILGYFSVQQIEQGRDHEQRLFRMEAARDVDAVRIQESRSSLSERIDRLVLSLDNMTARLAALEQVVIRSEERELMRTQKDPEDRKENP